MKISPVISLKMESSKLRLKIDIVFLILGRKGAGKTAVFQHFNNNDLKYLTNEDLTINLSLQNYSWDIHGLLATEGKASSLAYIQSWKYIIYLMSVKALVEANETNAKIKTAAKIIEKIYASPTPSLGQVVGQKLLQLSRIKLPSAGLDLDGLSLDSFSASGGEISFSDAQKDTSLHASLNRSVERLSDIFEAALSETAKGRRIIISFDRIDEAWDAASFEASQRVIAGLVGASEFINAKFKGSIRPLIFLREDIFETLDLNDKNNLRSDCGQLLAWSKDSLSRMILERVNFYAAKTG